VSTLPVFVLNLAQQSARREFMQQQLRALNIDPIIWPGVDGRALSADEMARHYDDARAQESSRAMTPGEVGCALGHLGIYRRIVEQQLPYALVLEDDAAVGRDTLDVLAALDAVMKTERPTVALLVHISHVRGWWSSRRLSPRHRLVRIWKGSCAHGYVLNRAAAAYLAETQYPIYVCADKWTRFRNSPDIDVWAVTPPCIGKSVFAYNSSALEADRRALKNRLKKRRTAAERLDALWRRLNYLLFQKTWYGVRRCRPALVESYSSMPSPGASPSIPLRTKNEARSSQIRS
jgi:glycosyl transferase family 25